MKHMATIIALALGLLVAPALAQVVADGTSQGDGIAKQANCTLSQASIFVVNGEDTQGKAHVKCSTAGAGRVGHLLQVEIMADGTRRVYQDNEFPWPGNVKVDKDIFTDVNTSCIPGSGRYALDMTITKVGGKTDGEQGVVVTLPVSNCS